MIVKSHYWLDDAWSGRNLTRISAMASDSMEVISKHSAKRTMPCFLSCLTDFFLKNYYRNYDAGNSCQSCYH